MSHPMTARTYTAAEVQAIARRAWEAGRDAGAEQANHFAEMNYCAMNYPEEAGMAASCTAHEVEMSIRDLQPPPDMGDIIGGEDD